VGGDLEPAVLRRPDPSRPGRETSAALARGTCAIQTLGVDVPVVEYTKSGDVSIAYSVVGDGPFDVVFISGSVFSCLDYAWEGPPADFFTRLASFSRLILFDKRGTGLSDRSVGYPDLETRMDDVRAVMDAVGSRRAAVLGVSEGGPMTILFAATYPERTAAAVLFGTTATFLRKDDYPWAPTREEYLRFIEERERFWGTEPYTSRMLEGFAPDAEYGEDVKGWWAKYIRSCASPTSAGAASRANLQIDARHLLPSVRVPTLLLASEKSGDVKDARYMAERIPGAELVELPGASHAWFANPEPIAREAERFLTDIWEGGEWELVETDRVLATVLFTDIVGSTRKAAELGDAAWRELLGRHHALIRRQLVRFQGKELDTAGDGFFASFDGPARAIRCARAIAEGVNELGIDIRAGLHTGECEIIDGKVGGIAVHIGARVASEAQPGEVLVSSTVKDLVAGSGIEFRERGVADLKGIPGEWRLYAVDPAG
jgi:pimeloyl-ACP methyl ester carboxylesterase